MSRFVAVVIAALSLSAAAADAPPGIEAAIRRGSEALKKALPSAPSGGHGVLSALALVKAGEAPDGSEVSAVLAAIEGRCSGSDYRPDAHHYYTAGLELMLLESLDPDRYRPQMEKILAYVLKGQRTSGAWFYPNQDYPGDTSITQYATLGLWSASRAGLNVPHETWDRLAVWHLRTQLPNGAFTYHPSESNLNAPPNSALTLGGTSSLLLARLHLFRGENAKANPAPPRDTATGRRFGVLEPAPFEEEQPAGAKPENRGYRPEATNIAIGQAVDRAVNWSAANYRLPPPTGHQLYYLYGLERAAALGNLPNLGSHDWYNEGADWLVKTQGADGTWSHESSGEIPGTAFAVLFLTRSTAKALGRAVGPPGLGGGLLAGGRGLPDDLGKVNVTGEGVKTRSAGNPLDDLLARLEDAKAADVPGVQAAVLEAVRFGDREKLIGQRERLLKLVGDPRPEVRRTALWSLGRGGRLEDVPVLINGIEDPDVAVAVEAHNALCVLSRRPLAFGIPGDPFSGLPETASDAERTRAADAWRERAVAGWRSWYQRVAPYEERDGLGVFR